MGRSPIPRGSRVKKRICLRTKNNLWRMSLKLSLEPVLLVRQFRGDRLLYLNLLYTRSSWSSMHAFLSFSAILPATTAAFCIFLCSVPSECAPSSPDV